MRYSGLPSSHSVSELLEISLQLKRICTRGCLPLQKWTSNSPAALQHLDSSALQPEAVSIESEDSTTKLLGLVWDPIKDVFRFNLQANFSSTITKRIALSETAFLFDPLDFISPVIITAKIFMQELWLAKLQWDDLLPERLQPRWWQFRETRHGCCGLSSIIFSGRLDVCQAHLFENKSSPSETAEYSSPRAFGCSSSVSAHFIRPENASAKRRACLSLDGLVGYSHLGLFTTSSLERLRPESSFTHSRIDFNGKMALHFRKGESSGLCFARTNSSSVIQHSLWWSGPTWLMSTSDNWPAQPINLPTDAPLEHRPGFIFTSNLEPIGEIWDLVHRYSSLTRLLRITAMCQRALHRFERSSPVRTDIQLTPDDLEPARLFWVLHIQSAHFAAELRSISNGNFLTRGHFLSALTPFIDSHGTLRVGGRLQHSSLNLEAKHPAILPRHSTFTTLVIADAHFKTLHGGT
ncbi:uncharacterized protein [Venturia canescens]|uniref:uncharacterized protein n=1 Tax=Venturia canescens TaxID=32260 RepID=UPI001C9D4F27|nr:uncharacterized protein LOC122411416 [Venturia canescens]